MIPDRMAAQAELKLAGELNPGPWVKHSLNVGEAARRIAERVPGLDGEEAYILGALHDIGRRVGVVNVPRHVYEGYRYAMDRGWDQVAKICMTHSYPLKEMDFDRELASPEEPEIKQYIAGCSYDEYDWLVQLCDSLAADYGFCILEKRLVDVARRYGVEPHMLERWERVFAIKEYFEGRMGCSVYNVLPDIGRTTLLCPPPWKPENKGAAG